MATVEQVWRRVLPPGTQLVAGEAGIYNELSWVTTLRPYPPGLDALKGSELILIDLSVASKLGATLPGLVTLVAERGASAICLLGEPATEALKEAESRSLPILRLPAQGNVSDLEGKITAFVARERQDLYRQEQELSQRLMEVALAGQGMTAILSRLQEMTGRKVWLLNTAGELVFPADTSAAGTPWKGKGPLSRLFAAAASGVIGLKLTEELSCFVGPLPGGEGLEGYLLVAAPSGELVEADRLAVKAGLLALSVEVSRRRAVEATEDRFQSEMIEALLSGSLSPSAVAERSEKLGLDVSSSYFVGAARVSASRQRPGLIARKAASLLGDTCHLRGDTLLIIHRVTTPMAANDLRRWAKEVARQISMHLEGPVTLGAGRAYPGLDGLRLSLKEAEEALSIGRQLFGPGSASFFGDLGVYRLLLTAQKDELKLFYRDYLGKLADYDQKHHADLLLTLQAILELPTLSETAQVLHIHRNTLLYRIQRISEIAGLDLEDGETRLALHLALRAGDIIRAGS